MTEEDAVTKLIDLGLTRYEARCYITLVGLGTSDPRSIAREAGIPHPNAYDSLGRLVRRGWVELVRRRPALYRARRPRVVKEQLVGELDDLFEGLERLYKTTPASDAELVYTIRESKNVMSKIFELVADAKEIVLVVGPWDSISALHLNNVLEDVMKRGVIVRLVTDAGHNTLPSGVRMRLGKPVAFDLVVDGSVALISLPDFSACGWVDSPAVARHLMQFLELLWQTSKSVPGKEAKA